MTYQGWGIGGNAPFSEQAPPPPASSGSFEPFAGCGGIRWWHAARRRDVTSRASFSLSGMAGRGRVPCAVRPGPSSRSAPCRMTFGRVVAKRLANPFSTFLPQSVQSCGKVGQFRNFLEFEVPGGASRGSVAVADGWDENHSARVVPVVWERIGFVSSFHWWNGGGAIGFVWYTRGSGRGNWVRLAGSMRMGLWWSWDSFSRGRMCSAKHGSGRGSRDECPCTDVGCADFPCGEARRERHVAEGRLPDEGPAKPPQLRCLPPAPTPMSTIAVPLLPGPLWQCCPGNMQGREA